MSKIHAMIAAGTIVNKGTNARDFSLHIPIEMEEATGLTL
jgi:hypothetical protein